MILGQSGKKSEFRGGAIANGQDEPSYGHYYGTFY